MNIDKINKQINETFCGEICNELSDLSLLDEYKKQKSSVKKIDRLKNILKKYSIDGETITNILNEFVQDLIPAGTKGVIRGLQFNKIIRKMINDNFKTNKNLKVLFETTDKKIKTDEIPDFLIINNDNNKKIFGFNQIDFTTGGAQMNRGYKYIMNNKSDENNLYLSVICKKVCVKKKDSKIYNIYNIGFEKKILCYPKELIKIIINFLDL